MVANAFNLSTQETEEDESLVNSRPAWSTSWVQGQPGLQPAETQQKESKNYNKIQSYKRQPFHLVESSKISAENNLIKMSCGLWLELIACLSDTCVRPYIQYATQKKNKIPNTLIAIFTVRQSRESVTDTDLFLSLPRRPRVHICIPVGVCSFKRILQTTKIVGLW